MKLKMRRVLINSERGAILPIVLIGAIALTITGVAFLNAGVLENRQVEGENQKSQAFYLAEAGLERTLWNLKQDYESGDRDWADGELNGVTLGEADAEGWRELIWPPVEPDLGPGTYLVRVKVINTNKLWIRSRGNVEDKTKVVQAFARITNASPWNNAIFARGGGAGGVVEGNALVAGSIHILGEGLEPTDFAMDISGTAGMRNNYDDMPDDTPLDLLFKVPPCPQVSFNGETIDSLGAELRVKAGKVGLSGTATIGEEDVFGNTFKETADGVYVSDGYGGNQGEINVYSDNGTEPYDMGAYVPFPSLTEPHPGYDTYLDYLYDNALIINENKISSTVGDFSHGPDINGNSISWNQSEGKLTINGLVRVNGDLLDLGEEKDEVIEYSGQGTILVARDSGTDIVGSIQVHGNLVAEGTYSAGDGFPHNALGLIAGELALAPEPSESQLMMTGAFFAENKVTSRKQNEIAGSFVTSWFDVADQVPRLYQVPDLALNLPPFMPGGSPDWYLIVGEWSELPPE